MPLTSAQTNTALNAVAAKTVTGDDQIVSVTLRFASGKAYDPEVLLDGLETTYGAGKVTLEDDAINPGATVLRFKIAA